MSCSVIAVPNIRDNGSHTPARLRAWYLDGVLPASQVLDRACPGIAIEAPLIRINRMQVPLRSEKTRTLMELFYATLWTISDVTHVTASD